MVNAYQVHVDNAGRVVMRQRIGFLPDGKDKISGLSVDGRTLMNATSFSETEMEAFLQFVNLFKRETRDADTLIDLNEKIKRVREAVSTQEIAFEREESDGNHYVMFTSRELTSV